MAQIADSIDQTPESFTTESAPVASEAAPRQILNVSGGAVGRRKEAIARVRLVPGSGTFSVNGRTLEDYFPNKLHQQLINDPFKVLEAPRLVRRHRPHHGWRPLGSGRRAPPRHRPHLERDRPREQPRDPQEGRLPHP